MVMPACGRTSAPLSFTSLKTLASSVPMTVRVAALVLVALVVGNLSAATESQSAQSEPMAMPARDVAMARSSIAQPRLAKSVGRGAESMQMGMQVAPGAFGGGGAPEGGGFQPNSADLPADVTRQRMVETANGEIEVEHLRQALDKAQALAAEAGGSVTSSNEHNLSGEGKFGTANIVVRVPVAKFRATWSAMLQIGKVRSSHRYMRGVCGVCDCVYPCACGQWPRSRCSVAV